MLESLAKYAYEHNLQPEPGFTRKPVRWEIVLTGDGVFLGVTELGDTTQKNNKGREFQQCPDLTQPEMISGGETRSHFLVDTAEVVVLYGADPTGEKTRKKHEYFLKLIEDAQPDAPELSAIAKSLADAATLTAIRGRLQSLKAKPNDKVTFRVGDAYPVDSSSWHDWWQRFRASMTKKKPAGIMTCFATGEAAEPVMTHNKIKGLVDVDGQPSGDVLTGFDKEAYRSYGLEQSANAAVSEGAMCAYVAGLNDLIATTGRRLAGAKVVHWFRNAVPPADDPLPWLEDPPEKQEAEAQHRARQLLESIRLGKRPDLAGNYYCALTLSGAGGRVMVRDWMEGQFEELASSVNSWFEDLQVTNLGGMQAAKEPGLELLVTSLLPARKPRQNYRDWVRPMGTARLSLLHSAIQSLPLQHSVVTSLANLLASFFISDDWAKVLVGKDPERPAGQVIGTLQARMGLVKAYHIRKYRKEGNMSMISEFKPYLNESHPNPAYQCGRLMALLAALQRRALGDVGAGVIQRYYAAASSTPALVLGRLTRTSQFHLNKLEVRLAYRYEARIAGVWGRIKDSVPSVLSLEDQSLFALGYYQQIAAREGRPDKENENKENNNG